MVCYRQIKAVGEAKCASKGYFGAAGGARRGYLHNGKERRAAAERRLKGELYTEW